MDTINDRPSGIPPPAYQEECEPVPPVTTHQAPAWTKLCSAPRENFAKSPLLRLPEPFLVKIMTDYCDEDDVLRLRHTSRHFMRLFSVKQDFQPMWRKDAPEKLEQVWKTPSRAYPEQGQPKFCSSCIEARDQSDEGIIEDLRHLWCSLCRAYHSELHFSHLQREEDDSERICIGREGRVKLCRHVGVSWAQIRTMAKMGGDGVSCKHDAINGVTCSHENCGYPHDSTYTSTLDSDGRYEIEFSTYHHIPFVRGPMGEKPSWFSVLKSINDILADKETFMPANLLAGCNPMRVFDPNMCSCLDWHVQDSEIKGSEPRDGFKWLLNNRHSIRRQRAGDDEHDGACPTQVDMDTDRCFGARHGFTMRVGRRQVAIDFKMCGDDGNMLVLQQATRMKVTGPTDPAWEDLIDAGSILSVCDVEMLGKTWCYGERYPGSSPCAVTTLKMAGHSLREKEWMQNHSQDAADDEEEEDEEEWEEVDGEEDEEEYEEVNGDEDEEMDE